MNRTASAHWSGGLKDGKGTFSAQSGVFKDTPYSFAKRFESEPGTNPEELIAAAHASCFTMALSNQLGTAGMTVQGLDTTCTVTFEKTDAGFTITQSHLAVTGRITGGDEAKFQEAAQKAKAGCPISRVLNTNITMEAKLA